MCVRLPHVIYQAKLLPPLGVLNKYRKITDPANCTTFELQYYDYRLTVIEYDIHEE